MSEAAALIGGLGVALAFLSRSRAALLAGFALIALAEAGLLLDGGSVGSVGPAALAGGVAGLGAVAGLAALLVRFPIAVAPALLVTAPLRLPFTVEEGSLVVAPDGQLGRLVPFYVVLGAAALALAWRLLRGADQRPLPRAFALPAAGFMAFTAASLLWAADPDQARDLLLFFWLPFGVLVATLSQLRIDARLPRLLGITLVAEAALFAFIGIGQALTHEIFFYDAKLESANAFGPIFRVTSMFDDPSHYGRFVVLGMSVVLVALWLARVRAALAGGVLALLAVGLFFSYSQSSFATLAVVALALALVAGDRLSRRLVGGAVLVVGVVGVVGLAAIAGGVSEDSFTSDRSKLVTDTAAVIGEHPVAGVGLGSQPIASRDAAEVGGKPRLFTSHTTPLTVAAEAGIVGLVLYGAMLFGAALMIAGVRRTQPALGLGLAALLLALFVHSLFYSGFFDNPITWGVFGIAAAASAASARPAGAGANGRGAMTWRLRRMLPGAERREEPVGGG